MRVIAQVDAFGERIAAAQRGTRWAAAYGDRVTLWDGTEPAGEMRGRWSRSSIFVRRRRVAGCPAASVETLEEWDSLRAVVLIAVLEEAFDLRIAVHEFPSLRSYAAVRDYLRQRSRL